MYTVFGPNGLWRPSMGGLEGLGHPANLPHVFTVFGPNGLWRPSVGGTRGSGTSSQSATCVHCIWPKWYLETFSGGRGWVWDIQLTCHMYTLHLAQMAFGDLQWRDGGLGHPANLPYMCTLYLAQMAFGDLQWSHRGQGWDKIFVWTTKWPCRDC